MPACAISSPGSKRPGGLVRVTEPVSTVLEMTEIQTRLLAEGGPAVLFENLVGDGGSYPMPVLVNLFGTVKRVAMGVTMGGASAPPRRAARSGRDCWPSCASPSRRGGLREALRAAAAGQDRDGDEAQDGRAARAVPGDRAAAATTSISTRCRSRPAGRASPRR